jgi:uncharacterized repeat protein (TIGR02543 family)
LYAKWTRNTYKVTFNTDDAAHTPATLDVLYDEKVTAPEITKTGHTLDGWYKEEAKTTKWNFGTDTVTKNITLYGTWTRNSYTVTFDLNGATGTAPVHPAVLYGGMITRPDPVPHWADWTVDGWYRNTAGTGLAWNFETDTVTENITLYAKWAVWLLSTETYWTVTNGSAVSISLEIPTEYTSYTDETHYTYKWSYQSSSGTIYEYEISRNGESAHEVEIARETNGAVTTTVYDRVYDADSGLLKQYTSTRTPTSSSGVTGTPSVTEYSYTVTLQNNAADGTKTYKYSTVGYDHYYIYTIKDGVTLSHSTYRSDGTLSRTDTYTFPDNPVIRERLPKLTVHSFVFHIDVGSSGQHETYELLPGSTDTSLTVRIKHFYNSTNVLWQQTDYTYTKRAFP